MNYKERQKQLCEQCSERCKEQACGYVIRNLQDDCSHLRVIMYGWKLGQSDTIEEIEKLSKSLGDSEGFHYNFYVGVMKLVEQLKKENNYDYRRLCFI